MPVGVGTPVTSQLSQVVHGSDGRGAAFKTYDSLMTQLDTPTRQPFTIDIRRGELPAHPRSERRKLEQHVQHKHRSSLKTPDTGACLPAYRMRLRTF